MTEHMADPGETQPKIDSTISHSARIWDYWLGGKDNYPADREMGDKLVAYVTERVEPGVVSCSRWRPDPAEPDEVTDVMHFCGIARRA